MSCTITPAEVAARLDRLPVGRFHYRFLALLSLGAWFDYYDNFVAGALAVALPRAGVVPEARPGEWFSAVGVFTAALPAGMFAGALFLGIACDRLGRRFAFVALLLLYSLATLAGGAGYYPLVAVAGPAAGFVLLLVTRFLAGAGVGGENVVLDAYVSEVMPRQVRGRAVAWTQAAAFTAFPVAALLARVLAPRESPGGWRFLLVIGSLGALFSWFLRRRLPESPRWAAAVGRTEEAAAALAQIEAAAGQAPVAGNAPSPAPATVSAPRAPFRAIWSPRYRGRTLLLVTFHLLQTVGYYGFMHWLPSLVRAKGWDYNDALSLQLAASLLAPIGPLLGVWSCERWQRKHLLVTLALTVASGLMVFGLAALPILLTMVAAGLVVCLNWFSAVFHAYQAELYPTEARATGVGFTYAWSRASMVAVDLFMPGLLAAGPWGALGLMSTALVGVAIAVGICGPLTNARTLEDVSPEEG
jgi:MFS transporter, putative metabolite:H+ symporter